MCQQWNCLVLTLQPKCRVQKPALIQTQTAAFSRCKYTYRLGLLYYIFTKFKSNLLNHNITIVKRFNQISLLNVEHNIFGKGIRLVLSTTLMINRILAGKMRIYLLFVAFFIAAFPSVFISVEAKNYSEHSNSHEPKSFEGPFVLENGLLGVARYQYYLSGRDTVLHGTFSFSANINEDTEEGIFNSISYIGIYSKGVKNGLWVFSSKKIRPTGDIKEDGFQLVYLTEGKEFIVKANFVSGVADGNWEIVEHVIKNSVSTDTITNMKAAFSNGRLVGSIYGLYGGVKFSGEVSLEGFVDKRWVFILPSIQNSKMEEHRIFDEGLNVNHFIVWGSDTIILDHVGLDTRVEEGEVWEKLIVNGNYFEIIETANLEMSSQTLENTFLSQIKDTSEALVIKSDKVFESVFISFSNKDNLQFWKLLEGSAKLKTVNVKLRKYPLDEETIKKLEATNKLLDRANDIIEGVFEDPNVEIGRLANQKLMINYEILKVYKTNIPKLTKLIKMFDKAAFEYINRKEVFKYLLHKIEYPDSIKYYFRDQYFTQEYKFPRIDLEVMSASSIIYNYFNAVLDDMIRIENEIDNIVENKLSVSKLKDKEKTLLRLKDSLSALYENRYKSERFNTYHEKSARKIFAFLNTKFENYALLEEQQKVDTIDVLLNCVESFLKVYFIQVEIPMRLKRIDEAYTRIVWNPFTMTDMNERMKSRVYHAFESDLLPYFFSSVDSFEDCEDILSYYENFDLIYNKMMEIRYQDTKDIEKQLKGERSLERILVIFNLELFKAK